MSRRLSKTPCRVVKKVLDNVSTAREHYRVDTALYNRVQAMLTSLQEVERLSPMMPMPVQQRMVLPLTTVHADLNGLLFTAYLLASVRPNSDDFDILGCPRWLLNICLAYYMFSPFINIVSTRLSHLAKHVYHPYATMFRAFITMVR